MCVRVTLNIIIAGSQHITRVAFLPIFPEIADLYGYVLGRGQEQAGVLGSTSR